MGVILFLLPLITVASLHLTLAYVNAKLVSRRGVEFSGFSLWTTESLLWCRQLFLFLETKEPENSNSIRCRASLFFQGQLLSQAGAQALLKCCSRSILFPSLPSGPPREKCAGLMKKHRHISQEVIQKCFSFAEFHNSREFCICYINRESYKTPETCQNQEVVYHHLWQQK